MNYVKVARDFCKFLFPILFDFIWKYLMNKNVLILSDQNISIIGLFFQMLNSSKRAGALLIL